MSESGFDIIEWVRLLLWGVVVVVFLIIVVKIDEIDVAVTTSLPLRTVMGEMSLLTTLETGIVSQVAGWSLCISDISSCSASSSPAPPIVRGVGSVDVHWDRLVVHPLWCVGGVILGSLLSLSSSSLSKSLVTVPSSSSVLGEEQVIRCVSSSKCRKAWRQISSISTILRRATALLRRDDGIK